MNKNILKSFILIFTLILVNNLFSADSIARSMSNDNAEVYIVSPSDNQVIENPITVKFGITDIEILPAGIKKEYSGHHHLLIDVEDLPDFSKPIRADKNHIHFGNGQTEVTIHLDQGTHTLQLLLGDYMHIPHKEPVISERITIEVK